MISDKRFRITALVISIIGLLLGVALIVWPEQIQSYFCVVIGVLLLIAGIVDILIYFIKSVPLDGMDFSFASGAICLVLGVVFILNREKALAWMVAIVGFFIMAGSLLQIQLAMNIRRLGGSNYVYLFFAALFTLIVGALFLFVPFKAGKVLNIFAGIGLVIDALIKIWFIIQMMLVTKRVKQTYSQETNAAAAASPEAGTQVPPSAS